MADTITSTYNLYIGFTNSENKVKYPVVLPNPKNNLTDQSEALREAAEALLTNRIILDDTTESDTFLEVTTAYTERKGVTKLEI